MLPYIAVLLPIIVGVSLLALDGAGRAFSLQTQLQNIADAAALAGASQLNRAPGARARATNAINNLVSNHLAGMDVTNVTLSTPVYYETLPVASQYFSSGTVSPDDGHARFVAVTLTHSMSTIFPVRFLNPGGTNSYTAGAQAVAGRDQIVCKYTPMFMCNPFEQQGDTYDDATAHLLSANTSQLVALQQPGGGGNAQWAPGNYGFLQSPTLSAQGQCGGGNEVTQAIARCQPNTCFTQSSVNFHPGNIANANDGLNTRFDIFDGSFQNCSSDALYPPAPNVRKGYLARQTGNSINWCRAIPCDASINQSLCFVSSQSTPTWPPGSPPARGFPKDNTMGSVLGNGQWDCAGYWSVAHPPALGHAAPAGCTSTATISRRSVYQYEIDQGYVSDLSPGVTVTQGRQTQTVQESGAPRCSSTPPNAACERRVLYGAVINCNSLGQPLQGAATNVPVAAFAKFFLTLPVPTSTSPVYAEYMGVVPSGGGGQSVESYPLTQLYR